MINCGGFPDSFEFSPIPRPFITTMLDNMENIDELKTVLKAFNVIYQKKGKIKYCSLSEISNEETVDNVKSIMNSAVKCGIFISGIVNSVEKKQYYYFINDKYGNNSLSTLVKNHKILRNTIQEEFTSVNNSNHNNIYLLYENNIGLLTPLIIEELKIAEEEYPLNWIEDAIKEAVELNKRNWKYVKAILHSWQTKGKENGKSTKHTERNSSSHTEGKYGSRVKR